MILYNGTGSSPVSRAIIINKSGSGGMADAPDSGSGAFTGVWVQIPSPAPKTMILCGKIVVFLFFF